ncbi:MAG: DUF84 family protein [Patescibacteria group bacterium]
MKFALGSLSLEKYTALGIACIQLGFDIDAQADLVSCDVSSGVSAQPYGMRETSRGAMYRAKGARKEHPDTYAVGIENGIVCLGGRYIDVAVIVLITPEGKHFVGTSVGIEVPVGMVDIARSRGFATTTVGDIIAEKMGGSKTDPHLTLTKGRISRRDILIDALSTLFCQVFHERR